MRYATLSPSQLRRYISISLLAHVVLLVALFTFAYMHQDNFESGASYSPAQVTLYQEPSQEKRMPQTTLPDQPMITPDVAHETSEVLSTNIPEAPVYSVPQRARSGRSGWYKDPQLMQTAPKSIEAAPRTAQQFAQEFSKVSTQKRRTAEAVYNLTDAKSHIAAQMNEIMDGRFKRQVVLALHAASVENQKPFHSYKNLEKKIDIKIILDGMGKIMSVEFVQSTGYPDLDAYIVYLIKLVKKFPKPRNVPIDGYYTLTIPTIVTCDATTQVLGFLSPGGGDYFG